MKLCAIIHNGKIKGIVPVEDTHRFGLRETYAHFEVKLLNTIPEQYNDPPAKGK